MPHGQAIEPIGEQLARALGESGVSQRQLAQRLAGSSDVRKLEAKRRWIGKIVAGKIQRPGMAQIERALNLPAGHFQLPSLAQARQRRDRLEALEEEVALLREERDSALREVVARLALLEATVESAMLEEAPESSREPGQP